MPGRTSLPPLIVTMTPLGYLAPRSKGTWYFPKVYGIIAKAVQCLSMCFNSLPYLHLSLQRHLIYSCARSRGNLFILNHLGCAPTVVEPPPPLLRGGWFHFGQRVRARLLVARVMELLNVKLEA